MTGDQERAELRARFEAIKAHYRPHMTALVARGNDWAIDPYAWDNNGRSGDCHPGVRRGTSVRNHGSVSLGDAMSRAIERLIERGLHDR